MDTSEHIPENLKKPDKKKAIKMALADLYNKAPKDNFMLIEFDYSKCLLLPYDEALKFLACLKQAELFTDRYNEPKKILPFPSDIFKTRTLSRKEFEDIKVAAILGVTVDELNALDEVHAPA